MTAYFWKSQEFLNDLKQEINNETHIIKIASGYVSLKGAIYLKEAIKNFNLEVEIYCSSSFNDQEPKHILNYLSTFSSVYIVDEPFLHSKIYELHSKDSTITYCGSANLTEGGLINNFELMVKNEASSEELSDFWEELWQNCVEVSTEVIELYEKFPVEIPSEIKNRQTIQLKKQLKVIYEQQCLENEYPDLTEFYFGLEDYTTFIEKYWEDASTQLRQKRKATQEKLLELHEEIEHFAQKKDLFPHYKKEHITSGIDPSPYNFGRVTGIWMRYGKNKNELNPFGNSRYEKRLSPIEQFHKHACIQLSIGSEGINIGMFHSTAHDGVDRGYVSDNWGVIKEEIIKVYDNLVGYGFVWTIFNNKLNQHRASFKIDEGSSEEFIDFYKKYDEDGFESFCMRHYETNDLHIKTYNKILKEMYETIEVILPLYNAMAFRIPEGLR